MAATNATLVRSDPEVRSAVEPGSSPVKPPRVAGLDGLRGLAAAYVLLFHCWLLTFRDYPSNTGPAWLEWLMYGRVAVVGFLVISGFSLAASAAANGWRLGGLRRFVHRRAWRILPPYWAALAFSVVIAWAVVPASHHGPPNRRTLAVFGLMLQDVVPARTPNGAFWSIGVEAELYLLLPLLLLVRRWTGALVMLAAVTLPVVVLGLTAPGGTPEEGATGMAVHLAPLFALGVVAAGILTAPERVRRLPWHWPAAVTAAPVVGLIVVKGPEWTVDHYFWIDLAVGPSMAMLLAAVATGRPAVLTRLLTTGVLRTLGSVSYSLYLVHLPIVMVVNRRIAAPLDQPRVVDLAITVILAVPLSLLVALCFAALFELPFQRHRSWASLRQALVARWHRGAPIGLGQTPKRAGSRASTAPRAVTSASSVNSSSSAEGKLKQLWPCIRLRRAGESVSLSSGAAYTGKKW